MRLLTTVFSLFVFALSFAKEYKNLERYTISTGSTELNRKDWLTKDRESDSYQWQQACLYNFSYYGGHKEYQSVEERRAFLEWMAAFIEEQGHQVKWPATNVLLFGLFVDAENKYTVEGIKTLVRKSHALVFDTAFVSFQEVHANGYILKGNEAKEFDRMLYEHEHANYYQTYLNQMNQDDLATLNKILDRKGLGRKNAIPEALEFDGIVQDYQQRLYWINTKVEPVATGNGPTPAELKAKRQAEKEKTSLREVNVNKTTKTKALKKEEKAAKKAEKEAEKMAKKQAKDDNKKMKKSRVKKSKKEMRSFENEEGLRKKKKK